MKDDQIRASLLEIEETIRGKAFETWRSGFVAKNLSDFTFEDENKLVYTEIHASYESEIERRIAESLPPSFDISDFMRSLPKYIEGAGLKDDATGKAIALLLEVSDFTQFKQMMLLAKQRDEERSESKQSEADELAGVAPGGGRVEGHARGERGRRGHDGALRGAG